MKETVLTGVVSKSRNSTPTSDDVLPTHHLERRKIVLGHATSPRVRVRTEGKDLFSISTVVYFGGIKTRFRLKSSGFSGVVVDVVRERRLAEEDLRNL